jgi:predicted secreted protein
MGIRVSIVKIAENSTVFYSWSFEYSEGFWIMKE